METAEMQIELQHKGLKDSKRAGVRITTRDLEILEFVLEMKFSNLSDIHTKFFRYMKDGTESSSLWWAYERIRQLVKCGYLTVANLICNEKLFLISEQGYYYLKNSYQTKNYCRPVYSIDIRTFNHDSYVNKVRVHLETQRGVINWQSERALTENSKFSSILTKEFRPDAVYVDNSRQRVAFEMEITQKANVRYDAKIEKFLQIVQSEEKLRLFDKVHYVCLNDNIVKKLQDKTQIFKSQFSVESVTEFIQVGAPCKF